MPLQTANQFQLGTDFSRLGSGAVQGAQLANQFQAAKQRDQLGAQQSTQFDQEQSVQRATILNQSARALKNLPIEQREAALQQLSPRLAEFNIDASVFQGQDLSDVELDNAIAGTQGLISKAGLTSAQREFETQTAGLSEADKLKARRVDLGLDARAGASAAERIASSGTTTEVAQSEAEIVQAKEEAKLQAQLKLKPTVESKIEKAKGDAKASTEIVNESFKRIGNITANVRNIDRAINAIDRGAKTGVIAKLVPSITAASRELRQIQNELGLDVIGSVTFGALSQGELDLALETAIDLGLEPDALKDVLGRKKDAQNKLIGYLDQQIQFLDDGGTLAGWRAQQKQTSAPEQTVPTIDLSQMSDDDLAAQLQAARAAQGVQ